MPSGVEENDIKFVGHRLGKASPAKTVVGKSMRKHQRRAWSATALISEKPIRERNST